MAGRFHRQYRAVTGSSFSALFGNDPVTGRLSDDPKAEADRLFDNLAAILAAAGAGLDDVVRVGIFMKHLQRNRPTFNRAGLVTSAIIARPDRLSRQQIRSNRRGRARYMLEVTAQLE